MATVPAKYVIPAHADHIYWLANNMSPADRDECAAGGLGPYRALSGSLDRSVAAWTGMVRDEPVCMFGVSPLDILGGVGCPWILTTPEVQRFAVTFLKLNREYLHRMLEIFPKLINFVDARHRRGIAWLKWLGFKFDETPVPYGPFGMMFYRFHMEK